jgi:hypothetical protein
VARAELQHFARIEPNNRLIHRPVGKLWRAEMRELTRIHARISHKSVQYAVGRTIELSKNWLESSEAPILADFCTFV